MLVGKEEGSWFREMQMILWGFVVVRCGGNHWLNLVAAMTKKPSQTVAQNLTLALHFGNIGESGRLKLHFF